MPSTPSRHFPPIEDDPALPVETLAGIWADQVLAVTSPYGALSLLIADDPEYVWEMLLGIWASGNTNESEVARAVLASWALEDISGRRKNLQLQLDTP